MVSDPKAVRKIVKEMLQSDLFLSFLGRDHGIDQLPPAPKGAGTMTLIYSESGDTANYLEKGGRACRQPQGRRAMTGL
jgi:hypothetical protein